MMTDDKGHYCFFVAPGTYELAPVVTKAEAAAGLRLGPAPNIVTVTLSGVRLARPVSPDCGHGSCACVRVCAQGPVEHANFQAVQYSIMGVVECLPPACADDVRVVATPVQGGDSVKVRIGFEDMFMMAGLWSGDYTVTVESKSTCWGEMHGTAKPGKPLVLKKVRFDRRCRPALQSQWCYHCCVSPLHGSAGVH